LKSTKHEASLYVTLTEHGAQTPKFYVICMHSTVLRYGNTDISLESLQVPVLLLRSTTCW